MYHMRNEDVYSQYGICQRIFEIVLRREIVFVFETWYVFLFISMYITSTNENTYTQVPTERSLFRGGPIQLQTQRRLTRWIDAEEATKDCLNRSQYRSREAASSQYIHDLASSMSSMRNHDKLLSSLFDMVATTVRGVVFERGVQEYLFPSFTYS